MDIMNVLLIPIGAGFVTSVVFLIFMFNVRPKISISDKICRRERDRETVYTIKIINKSRFSMYDIKVTLLYSVPYNVEDGTNLRNQFIKLSQHEIAHIPCKKRGLTNATYAVLINAREDIDELWKGDNTYIEFQLCG